jgi:hypothetical protein
MKIRHDTVFLSSVLFTIVFAWLARWEWWNALPSSGRYNLETPWREVSRLTGEVGRLSLVILLIGLIVLWTGYLQKLRWTWFILFVIVFGWAFPVLIWHDVLFNGRAFIQPVSEWLALLANAVREPGPARFIVEEMLLFSLMVVALLLPVKSFLHSPRRTTISSSRP